MPELKVYEKHMRSIGEYSSERVTGNYVIAASRYTILMSNLKVVLLCLN